MRRSRTLAFLFVCCFPMIAHGAVVDPSVQSRIAAAGPAAEVPVIVQFADRVDVGQFSGRAAAPALIRALQDRAGSRQARVLAFLNARGRAANARSFWINNSMAVSLPAALVDELARFEEIERIDDDVAVVYDGRPVDGGPVGAAPMAVDWNLTMIRAPQVWSNLGYDGTGIVVGSMDTGFDPNHPALQGKWRGGTNSWKDIINGQPNPYDDQGHGTHTIGTMVGGDGPGPFVDDIGVAYNARFISAKVLNAQNGFNSASIVISGAQWMLDPDGDPDTDDFPHVINNSWGFNQIDFTGFYSAVAAWRAVGIIPVFSIGNSGPGGATAGAPGNYNNTIGVAATTSSDVVASFSSRGPSPAGAEFPPDQRKPDLSAPGEFVRSSVPGGFYSYWSGTSMAAPHVAGTLALILEAHPGSMSFHEAFDALIATSVDRGIAGYDYDYGYGRLDALNAVTEAQIPGIHLTGTGSGHSVELSWNASVRPGVIRYDVYRSPRIQDPVAQVVGSTTGTTFTDLHRFGTSYYRVRAVRASDQLPFTNEVGITSCLASASSCASVNGFSTSPVVADFDGDGELDVAVTNTAMSGTIEVVFGDGAGHFGSPASFPAGDRPSGLVTGDFNSDAIADLAVTNDVSAGTVSILLGNGDGTFGTAVPYSVSPKPMGIVCGDFNQDGIADLAAVGNTLNKVSVLIGNGFPGVGDGTFAPVVTYTVSTLPTRLVTADFNEDGVLDLAAACNGSGRVSVLLGNQTGGHGDGTFGTAMHYGSGIGTLDLVTGDFNADGILDLAAIRNVDPGFVSILRGQGSGGVGDGTFAPAVYHAAGALPQGITAGDLNGDGITDVCVANGSVANSISVLLGTGTGGLGDGGFEPLVSIPSGQGPSDIVIADLDHDATPDLVIASFSSFQNVCARLTGCTSDAGAGLALVTPNGGEEWAGSTWNTIAWTKDPGVISVDLEVSRDAGATWETIATDVPGTSFPWFVSNPTSAPGAARIRVSDRRLSSGDTNDAGFTITPDIRTDVPASRGASMALAIENPAHEGLRVRFALPSDAPAAISVLDAAGRRIERRALSSSSAGEHTIDLGARLRPGIYWVSLEQGVQRITRKAAVVR